MPKSDSKKRIPKWASKTYIAPIENEVGSKAWKRNRHIVDGLMKIYKSKILPLERSCRLVLHPSDYEITEAEWHANPMVLLLGQYSTGKTTFIKHLLGGVDFPGMNVGPEPTSDKFMALISASSNPKDHASEHAVSLFRKGKTIKGNSLTVMPELPFANLSSFGTAFLDYFEGSIISPDLKSDDDKSLKDLVHHVTIVDTPGILSGDSNQRLSRRYDYAQVAKWFADRADMILLLFDAHKLDISDEYQRIIQLIRDGGNSGKVRCVLNKSDSVEKAELVRVYGSLLWGLGKIFKTPEVARVYCGSFWNKSLVYDDFEELFEKDEEELVNDLRSLPLSTAERKVNLMVKRVRLVKVHLCILGSLRANMPWLLFLYRQSVQEELIENLESVIIEPLLAQFGFSAGDLPDINHLKSSLKNCDFMKFPKLDKELLYSLDEIINHEIPQLIRNAETFDQPKKTHVKEEKIVEKSIPRDNEGSMSYTIAFLIFYWVTLIISILCYSYYDELSVFAKPYMKKFKDTYL